MTKIRLVTGTPGIYSIDTIDIPNFHKVNYEVTIITPTINQYSYLECSSDGNECYQTLESFTSDNSAPIFIETNCENFSSNIIITTTEENNFIIANRVDFSTSNYGENTNIGKLIKHTSGYGIDWESSANTVLVRSPLINSFGPFTESMFLGIDEELLNDNWIGVNGSKRDENIFIASAQKPNYHYQEIAVEPDFNYVLDVTDLIYTIADEINVIERSERQQGQCYVRVGSSPGGSDLLNFQATINLLTSSFTITPVTDKVYVSIGFGDINNTITYDSISFKKNAPFETWNVGAGTTYVKWDDIGTLDTLLNIIKPSESGINISIETNADNSVLITQGEVSVNVGTQFAGTNKLSFTKLGASLNADTIVPIDLDYSYVTYIQYVNMPLKLSYVPVNVSNIDLQALSSYG